MEVRLRIIVKRRQIFKCPFWHGCIAVVPDLVCQLACLLTCLLHHRVSLYNLQIYCILSTEYSVPRAYSVYIPTCFVDSNIQSTTSVVDANRWQSRIRVNDPPHQSFYRKYIYIYVYVLYFSSKSQWEICSMLARDFVKIRCVSTVLSLNCSVLLFSMLILSLLYVLFLLIQSTSIPPSLMRYIRSVSLLNTQKIYIL